MIVVAMSAVHEHMHQRTSKQNQERKIGYEVRAVFSEQVDPGNQEKSDQNEVGPRGAACVVMVIVAHGSHCVTALLPKIADAKRGQRL